MTELEKVEKLREKANVSFAEAKEALDASGGDILDALIYLENQGKATVPPGGGCFSGDAAASSRQEYQQSAENSGKAESAGRGESFGGMMSRLGNFLLKLLDKGNNNYLDATDKDGKLVFSCPITVVVLLLMFFFWVVIPMLIISMFCGLRYSFRGENVKDSVNQVMDSASGVVDDIKKSFAESSSDANNSK
jgi:hypothetical protein